MELTSPSSLFLTLLTVILILKLLIKTIINPKHNPNLPPGPPKLPIIGSIHHLLGSSLPHHRFHALSASFGPLIHLKLGELSLVVASSPAAAREITAAHDLSFAYRPSFDSFTILTYGNSTISFAPYGPYWREIKKICVLELLTQKRVRSFRAIREEEAADLIRSVASANGSAVNLSKKIIAMTNNVVMRAAIGDEAEEQSRYLEALEEAIRVVGGFNLADMFPSKAGIITMVTRSRVKAERCHRRADRVLDDILRRHREKRRRKKEEGGGEGEEEEEDLLDVLLSIQEDQSLQFDLTDDNIKAIISDIFGAGTETASTVLLWAMAELIRNPRVMKKVQKEVREVFGKKAKITEDDIVEGQLNYLQMVIKESLRLHPPLPLLLPRECRKKCEVLGYEIPERTRVMLNVWAIGRDPQYWDDAEDFKPERFEGSEIDFKGTNFEFLPFGAGRRMCPGISFALPSMEFALAQLLYYYDWQMPDGLEPEDLDMSESFMFVSRRRVDLCLLAIPHVPILAA